MKGYRLLTGTHKNTTVIKDVYFSFPFKLVEVREDKTKPLLEVMIMSSSPGLLNNDKYDMVIDVIARTGLNLQTQSYQRVFDTVDGAGQNMVVNVGEYGYFSHVPHPMVPHKGAKFVAYNRINLEENSSLVWGEILTGGRKLMGEHFVFRSYHSITEIFMDSKLIFKDNLYLNPDLFDASGIGLLEGHSHQGSLLFMSQADPEVLMEFIKTTMETHSDILWGISKLDEKGFLLRCLAQEGEILLELFRLFQKQVDNIFK